MAAIQFTVAPMLFLLNDVVLNLSLQKLAPPLMSERFAPLTLGCVQLLGAELFSEEPRLQRLAVGRAERLAMLIVAKEPQINAALFVAPSKSCAPHKVAVRYASLGPTLLAGLYERQQRGALSAAIADTAVWGRLAA
jgi:hypothetical protein